MQRKTKKHETKLKWKRSCLWLQLPRKCYYQHSPQQTKQHGDQQFEKYGGREKCFPYDGSAGREKAEDLEFQASNPSREGCAKWLKTWMANSGHPGFQYLPGRGRILALLCSARPEIMLPFRPPKNYPNFEWSLPSKIMRIHFRAKRGEFFFGFAFQSPPKKINCARGKVS